MKQLLLIAALFGAAVIADVDKQTTFLTYQPIGSIQRPQSILYTNFTGYAFSTTKSGFGVSVSDLTDFLNVSFTNPPDFDSMGNDSTYYSLDIGGQSFGSPAFYQSNLNASNTGFYLSASTAVIQFNPVNFTVVRQAPIVKGFNSLALNYMFVDSVGHNLFAPTSPGDVLYIYDLEKFDANSTLNGTLAVNPCVGVIFNPTTRIGLFFGQTGFVDVWNTATIKSVGNFSTSENSTNYNFGVAASDFSRDRLYVVSSANYNGSSTVSVVLQIFDISNVTTLTGFLEPIASVTLNPNILNINSIYIDTVGGQAFVGLSDSSQGNFLRVDLLRNTVVETVPVSQDLYNGRTPMSFLTGVQNQSLVMYTESSINVFDYPTTCPSDCTDPENGYCDYGTCVCSPLYTGDDCSTLACNFSCGEEQNRGKCFNGGCQCDTQAWTGTYCEIRQCPNACSGNGQCGGSANNYTCTCNLRYTGTPDCSVQRTLTCEEIPTAQECTGRSDCGYCQSEGRCMAGNNIGPVNYACPDWFTGNPKDIGIMAFAIIYIIICGILLLINIISALVLDHENATELIATKRLTATSIRKNWWRDERSNMGWLLFEQLQFISLYGLITVAYSTRILSFTRYFDWTCLVIPLPGYMDSQIHPERSSGQYQKRDYEQYANGNDSETPQIFYAQMVWLAIAFGGFTILNLVYSVICTLVRGTDSKQVFFSRLVHMWMRMLNVLYFPLIVIAASHTYYGGNSIAGSIIVLIVFGLGLPALSFGLTFGRAKQLFRYEWRAKFGAFYSTFHFNRPYFQLVILAKKAVAGLLIGFMAAPLDKPTLAFGQVFGAIGVYIIFIIVICLTRPYLDKVHMLLDIGLNVVNIISIGMALTNYASPSLIGDIIFLLLQIIGLLIVLGAFIHCWLAMEKVNCCQPKNEDEANTSELATMKM